MSRVYSSRQIGKMIGADPSSVNRWIDGGRLEAYRTPGGHRRVQEADLIAFLDACGMPRPAALSAGQSRVLLLDPDARRSSSLRRALQRAEAGLTVDAAATTVDALLQLGEGAADGLVIALEAGGDAADLCRQLKADARTKRMAIVAAGAKISAALRRKLEAAGADAVLVRPFKAAALLDAIGGRSTRA